MLKKIITDNVKPIETDTKIKLIIYYKTRRTSNVIIKNSCLKPTTSLQKTSLVYQYTFRNGKCSRRPSMYICSTTTNSYNRITTHRQDGGIKRHNSTKHGFKVNRTHMEENITVIHEETDKARLRMTKAVYIHNNKPAINIQHHPESSLPSHRRTPSYTSSHTFIAVSRESEAKKAHPSTLIG